MTDQAPRDLRDLTELEREHEEFERSEAQARREAIMNRPRFEGLQVDPEIDFYPEVAHREPGDTNIVRWGFDLHPQVTGWASGLLVVFIAFTLLFQDQASSAFNALLSGINTSFGWFYILSANIFVLAGLFFAFSRFGKIRLGGPQARPEFTTAAWYSMLISAGMGIGLMFWSVAEPIFHLDAPPPIFGVEAGSPQAAEVALATTFFHWGLHPWGIYALVALALGFFAYNRGLPLTFRSVFYPLLGPRIYGTWGNVIDVLTVLATLFGLATSLGLGVGQAAAGLNSLFDFPDSTTFQVILIAAITGMATISVVAGLDAGVKRLSQLNVYLAAVFLVFIIVVGPTLFLLAALIQSVGFYGQVLPELSFWNEAFGESGWQGSWTVFYWGWWISWSPFVGMFIARISKGRSIRELILGVMIVPSLLSFVWLAVFGGAGLNLQLAGDVDLASVVNDEPARALFAMLQAFPLTEVTSIAGILLVVSFFVTSSDSGSLVVDHLTSGGKLDSPKPQRVFWAVMEGLVASVLLIGGGLSALQTAAVTTGLPFTMILLIMCWSMYRAFHEELDLLVEYYEAAEFRRQHPSLVSAGGSDGDAAADGERQGDVAGADPDHAEADRSS